MSAKNMPEILIIEDNPGDALLITELLEDVGSPHHVTIVKNGQKALDILGRDDPNGDHLPDLVILDLNLPKVNGFEVLMHMREAPTLRSIPVVVMTGSSNKDDEVKARSMGVADYCIKPGTPEDMKRSTVCLRGHLESLMRNDGSCEDSGA